MSWLQQRPSGEQIPTWSRQALLAGFIVLVSGSALVPLWSVARALGTYVTLEATDGNRWQESTARPMLLMGLLGLAVAIAGILMSIRLMKAIPLQGVGLAALAALLAVALGVGGQAIYQHNLRPWPGYHAALDAFPAGSQFRLVTTVDTGGSLYRVLYPPLSTRIWLGTGSPEQACDQARVAFASWVNSTEPGPDARTVRSSGLSCILAGRRGGLAARLMVGPNLASIQANEPVAGIGRYPGGPDGPAVALDWGA